MTCPTLKPCSQTSSVTRPVRMLKLALSTSSSAWLNLCWAEIVTQRFACWAARCWPHVVRRRRCWSRAAARVKPCAEDAVARLTRYRWPGPTSSTAIASLSATKRDVMTPWRASEVRYNHSILSLCWPLLTWISLSLGCGWWHPCKCFKYWH